MEESVHGNRRGEDGEYLARPVAFPQQPSRFHPVGLRIHISHVSFGTISDAERVMQLDEY